MPGPESLDATQKVGAQAEALGKLIRQRTTSLSQVRAGVKDWAYQSSPLEHP